MKIKKSGPSRLSFFWDGRSGDYLKSECVIFTVLTDDLDNEISASEGPPFRLAEGPAAGVPLAQIIGELNASLVLAVAAKDTQITTLTAAAKPTADALVAANAQIATLQAQLAALQPVAINGVPQVITMVQAQLALLAAGLLDRVNAALSAIPGDAGKAAMIEWDNSVNVHRDNALLKQMQILLGLTDAQIDTLFIAASKL